MDFDDLFADEPLPVVNIARGRFQPKSKQRPIKETTAPVDVTVGDSRLLDPLGVSLPTSEVVGTIEQLKENEGTEHAHSEVAASDGFEDLHLSFQKAAGQNADVFAGLECLNDFASEPTNQTDGGESAVEGLSSENIAASTVCHAPEAQTCPDLLMTQDPVHCKEATISDNARDGPFDDGRLEKEVQQERTFPDLNCLDFTSEAAVASGWRAGKYKPKPKVQTENEKSSNSLSHPGDVESVMNIPNALFVSSETECMPEGSIPVFPPDDVFDYSSIDLGDIIPPDPTTSEFSMNEELTNFARTHTDTASSRDVQQEDVPVMNENQGSDKSCLAGKETEGGKSSRQLRKRVAVTKLIDEPDEAHYNDGFIGAPPSSTVDEEGHADEVTVDNASQRKRAPRKSKKPATENGKPVRKRKKANEALAKSNKGPPKKFSHSTRRKRIVSKELLETPEDEIDPQKVPIKDLILLAEYKERLASKEAKASKTPMTNQSAENSIHEEDYHNEEETFASEKGNGPIGDQSTPRVQSSSVYFNYQSFMKKTPTVRWSKQETELFYEAIRQFGTDLSMVQQLFPGRTRHQVKLKYKKEERKYPLRLTEALTNRAKDHSHFEKVIEQLQQVAAQAAQDAKTENSVDLTGDDEELNPEVNDKAGKVEQDQDGEADVVEVQDNEIDGGDDDIWNSYKSEF